MKDEQNKLDVQFQIAKLLIRSIETEPLPSGGGERITCRFSLNSRIEDPKERQEMLQHYRMALEEVVPLLPQHMSKPSYYDTSNPQNVAAFEQRCGEVIDDTMQHVQAIFEGTHRWSPELAKNTPEEIADEAKQAPHLSGVQVILHVRNQEPGVVVLDLLFLALLFDLTAKRDGLIYPMDSDPQI